MRIFACLLALAALYACSNDDSKPKPVQVKLDINSAATVATDFCAEKNTPQSALGQVFSTYAARSSESCPDGGTSSFSIDGTALTLTYTDFCLDLNQNKTTLNGTVQGTISPSEIVLAITNMNVVDEDSDLTINGEFDVFITGDSLFGLNLSVLNNETGKLFKLENITVESKSFLDAEKIVGQLKSFDGDLSFTSGLNYSGSIFYTDIGQFEFSYANDKTILIDQNGAKLTFSLDNSVTFTPASGDQIQLEVTCP